MKKIHIAFYFLILCFLSAVPVTAQLNYAITTTTPGFTALSGASLTALSNFNNVCGDQMVSPAINLGFNFSFGGVNYNQIKVSDNGEIFLGASATSCNDNCGQGACDYAEAEPANLSTGSQRPAICPLWDDLGFTANGSKVSYQPTGTVCCNRTMKIEWLLMNWKYNNSNLPHGTISFQVILYESPAGQIDFIYKQEAQALGTGTKAPTARIGLMGATDYYSLSVLTHSIVKSPSAQFVVTTKPVDGIRYRWSIPGGLPIELTSFTGENSPKGNLLKWSTASETNNNYFTIERSSDGQQFEPVAYIKGAGNSNSSKQYDYLDNAFPESYSVIYYRLKQTDLDDTKNYSPMISIDLSDLQNKAPVSYFDHTTGELIISYNFTHTGIYYLDVTDIMGRLIYHYPLEIISKEKKIWKNSLPFPDEGVYIVKLSGQEGNTLAQSKFIKLNK